MTRLIPIPEIEHWQQMTASPAVAPGALHLWRIRTGSDSARLADLWPLLSPPEYKRALRLRFDFHRERYVRAHAGLRRILAYYISCKPQHIEFTFNEKGKPLIGQVEADIEFNLTTSADLALLAICVSEPVGVDCEQVRERRDLPALAQRTFAPDEASRIAAAGTEERLELFHRAWTALEAGVKADGRGLARRNDAPAFKGLEVKHCVPEPGYVAAVARRDLPGIGEWMTMELAPG